MVQVYMLSDKWLTGCPKMDFQKTFNSVMGTGTGMTVAATIALLHFMQSS